MTKKCLDIQLLMGPLHRNIVVPLHMLIVSNVLYQIRYSSVCLTADDTSQAILTSCVAVIFPKVQSTGVHYEICVIHPAILRPEVPFARWTKWRLIINVMHRNRWNRSVEHRPKIIIRDRDSHRFHIHWVADMSIRLGMHRPMLDRIHTNMSLHNRILGIGVENSGGQAVPCDAIGQNFAAQYGLIGEQHLGRSGFTSGHSSKDKR